LKVEYIIYEFKSIKKAIASVASVVPHAVIFNHDT